MFEKDSHRRSRSYLAAAMETRYKLAICFALAAFCFGVPALTTRRDALRDYENQQKTDEVVALVVEYEENPRNASKLTNAVCIAPDLAREPCAAFTAVREGACTDGTCCYRYDERCKSCRECARHERVCVGSGDARVCHNACVEYYTRPCCTMERYCSVTGKKQHDKVWGHEWTPTWTVNFTHRSVSEPLQFTVNAECGFNDETCLQRFAQERGEGEQFTAYYRADNGRYTEEEPDNGSKNFTISYVLMGLFVVCMAFLIGCLWPEILFGVIWTRAKCRGACCGSDDGDEEVRPRVDRHDSADDAVVVTSVEVMDKPTLGGGVAPAAQTSRPRHIELHVVGEDGTSTEVTYIDVGDAQSSIVENLVRNNGRSRDEYGTDVEFKLNVVAAKRAGRAVRPYGCSNYYVVSINVFAGPKDADYVEVHEPGEPVRYILSGKLCDRDAAMMDKYNGATLDAVEDATELAELCYTITTLAVKERPSEDTRYVWAINERGL